MPIASIDADVCDDVSASDHYCIWFEFKIYFRLTAIRIYPAAHSNWRAILYFRMRDCKVVRLNPSRAAAPSGPPTRPPVSFSTSRINARSVAFEVFSGWSAKATAAGLVPDPGIATRSSGPVVKIRDRSIGIVL